MNDKQKKPGAVSSELGVTPATLRNYVKQFAKHLSKGATVKTGRKFTTEDIATLKKANALLREGSTYDEVNVQLSPWKDEQPEVLTGEVFTDTPPPEPEPEDTQQRERAIQPFEWFTQQLDIIQETNKAVIDAKEEHIQSLNRQIEHLKSENARLNTPWLLRQLGITRKTE